MNPRYLAYCSAHGNTPEEQALADATEYPGGVMAGFILWISQKSREFAAAHPEAMLGSYIYDHSAWDSFLGVAVP